MKELLNLNLNYAHKNLSSAFRIISASSGIIMLIVSILGFINTQQLNLFVFISLSINLITGILLLSVSTKHLPKFTRKFITINELSFKYKLISFFPRRKFLWKNVEEIEIDRHIIKVRLDNEVKPRTIYIGVVAYQDFELLQKAIVELCMEQEIDIR